MVVGRLHVPQFRLLLIPVPATPLIMEIIKDHLSPLTICLPREEDQKVKCILNSYFKITDATRQSPNKGEL